MNEGLLESALMKIILGQYVIRSIDVVHAN